MRVLILSVLVCATIVVAQNRNRVEIPNATPEELDRLFAKPSGAKKFVDCVVNPRTCSSKKAGGSTLENRLFQMSKIAPHILRVRGDCTKLPPRINCDAKDHANIQQIIKIMQTKYPKQYRRLITSSK